MVTRWNAASVVIIVTVLSTLVWTVWSVAFDVAPPVTKQHHAEEALPTADDIARAAQSLSSESRSERSRALLAISAYINRGHLSDLRNKTALFAQASTSTDPQFAYNLSFLLAKLPMDAEIVNKAREALGEKTEGSSKVVAALVYLERHSPKDVASYFRGKEYESLSEAVRVCLSDNPDVSRLRMAYVETTLDKYLAWQPSREVANQPNPFYKALLKIGGYRAVTRYIIMNHSRLAQPDIPPRLVSLMGEMGQFEFFEILLKEYQARPSSRTAVSLGACTGSLRLHQTLNALSDERLQSFLKDVFGEEVYKTLKDLTREQIAAYWLEHYEKTSTRCMERSRPQP